MTTPDAPPCPLCGQPAATLDLAALGEVGQALALAAVVRRLPQEADIGYNRLVGRWLVIVGTDLLGHGATLTEAILMAGEKEANGR